MNDFGPKRPMSEDVLCASKDTVKAKRGRPKKKPDYDRDKEIEAFQAKAVELFGEPYDDRIERSEDAPSIRDVARAMDTTPLRVRKMLVTAGVYSGTVKYYAQIRLQVWQNSVCTGQGNLPLIT